MLIVPSGPAPPPDVVTTTWQLWPSFVPWPPSSSVASFTIVYVPAAAYVWVGAVPLPVLESPKSQATLVTVPSSSETVAENVTASPEAVYVGHPTTGGTLAGASAPWYGIVPCVKSEPIVSCRMAPAPIGSGQVTTTVVRFMSSPLASSSPSPLPSASSETPRPSVGESTHVTYM